MSDEDNSRKKFTPSYEMRTISLPNSGCYYQGSHVEDGKLVVEYGKTPGIHMQALKKINIIAPTDVQDIVYRCTTPKDLKLGLLSKSEALEKRLSKMEQEGSVSNKQFKIDLTLRLDALYSREENLSDEERREVETLAELEDRYLKLEDRVREKQGLSPRPTSEDIKKWCGYIPDDREGRK